MQRSRSKPTVVTRLNDKSLDLKKQVNALKSKDQSFTDWIYIGDVNAPAYQNTWVSFSDGSDGVIRPSFIKDSAGWVHLQGVMKSGVLDTVAFILPASCRPGKPSNAAGTTTHLFPVYNAASVGVCEVLSDGSVVPHLGNVASFYLYGISFRAEN